MNEELDWRSIMQAFFAEALTEGYGLLRLLSERQTTAKIDPDRVPG